MTKADLPDMSDYEKIFRKFYPHDRMGCPYGRRQELSDLWPVDQEEFKRLVDNCQYAEKVE